MQSRKLGKTDVHLSPIIMGTWQTGKSMWTGIDDSQSEKAVRAAMDAGITTFDTAEVYGNGHSEKVLGKAIGSRRDEVQILSKVFSNHLKYDQVVGACNRSLKNLGPTTWTSTRSTGLRDRSAPNRCPWKRPCGR